jgi:hypothetical protein
VTRYEVTTERLTPKGRVERTEVVEAIAFTQERRTATFTDVSGKTVATVKRVRRVCWSS